MSSYVPRVAAIHDMSCFGRCSLTVIMPVLSVMGLQVCPLPTAVLSTHLGGFNDIAFVDFTDKIKEFASHWKAEGIAFDCIYSGFLASEEQIDVVSEVIREFSVQAPLVLVDPVMGDEGKLYSVYTPHMQKRMKTLISRADVITPNYTEACFLLEKEYQPGITQLDGLKPWLTGLADFGPRLVVITGIHLADGKIANLGYDKRTGEYWKMINEHIPVRFPGTGDIFASVLAGALLQGCGLNLAMKKATDFVTMAIKTTYQAQTPSREGVLLEKVLPELAK